MRCLDKTLFYNGDFICMDKENSHAEAVLVSEGRIEAIGATEEVWNVAGTKLKTVDMEGLTVFPGFIDSHSHLDMLAAWADFPYCGGKPDLEGSLAILRDFVKSSPDLPVLMGYGYDDTATRDGRGPTLSELDAISPDRPLVLAHISLHAAYVNSAMLKAMGIPLDRTSDDGEIVCADGKPTGLLTENRAIAALGMLPKIDEERLAKGLRKAMSIYNAQGFTSCIGGGLGLNNLSGGATLRCLGQLELEGRMTLRCHLPILDKFFEEALTSGLLAGPGSDYVRPHGMKILTDGSIQAWTAALATGYHDKPNLRPLPLKSQDEMDRLVALAHSSGQQVVAHGNGDAAIEMAIVALERAQQKHPRKNPHHLLIHCQTVSDSQLERMKKAGFEPSFFVLHVWNWGDRHRDIFLGPERASRIDPCGSAVRIGLPFSLHADTPVLPQMTMRSIQTAVTRLTSSGQLLGPDQRISLLEALRAYTVYPAGMCLASHDRGTIEVGKFADFTLLDGNPLTADPEKIGDINIRATICQGRQVYGDLNA